jgi:hypothetical protein
VKRAVALLLLVLALPARAETPTGDAKDSAAPAPAESSPSSPPLATDDPGTPGRGGYELNFITSCDHAASDRSCAAGIDAAFGIGNNAQFRISKSSVRESTAGDAPLHGVGPTDVGIKYRFYDDKRWRFATFPSIDLDDGTRRRRSDGAPVEREGRSVYLPLIISREFASPLGAITVVGNLAWRSNLAHSANDSTLTSLAVGTALAESSRVMTEVVSECDAQWQQCRRDVRVGFVRALFETAARTYQTSLFGSIGIGRDASGEMHRTVLVGLSVARASQ